MVDPFLESPWWSVGCGAIFEIVLLGVLLLTGQRKVLLAMIAVLILAGFGVVLARFVVTDREQIVELFDRGAARALANDVEGLLALTDPGAANLHHEIRRGMGQGRLTELAITSLDVKVDRTKTPPMATADLFVKFKVNAPRQQVPYGELHGRWLVRLRKQDDRWLITAAEPRELMGAK